MENQLSELKQKLQKTEDEFQTYKKQAREMQEFLEQESAKKQEEIRKLKEQSIKKQKNFKTLKSQMTQLQAEMATLKNTNADKVDQPNSGNETKILEENQGLKKELQLVTQSLNNQQSVISQLEKQKNKLDGHWQTRFSQLTDEYQRTRHQIDLLRQQKDKLVKQLKQAQSKNDDKRKDSPVKPVLKKESIKNDEPSKETSQIKEMYEQKLKKMEEEKNKAHKQAKQYKQKMQSLIEDNEQLKQNLINFNSSVGIINTSLSPLKLSPMGESPDPQNNRISYSCLVLTKAHYTSPFLQIHQDKSLIKIYKSTRSGCFQKSMGCYKHKFDQIAYEQETIVTPIVNKIKDNEETNHSVILFGVKKSNKKYLMSKILVNLKELLLQKLSECYDDDAESIYLKRSADENKNCTYKGVDKESIIETIDRVIALGQKNEKKSDKHTVFSPKKTSAKSKVRYFSIRISDFQLEIGTSSFTNLVFRDKFSYVSMLNNIFYSKLPDILQSTISHKHLVLVINPIVGLYDDCKNTLSTTFCRHIQNNKGEDEWKDWRTSPVKDDLNQFNKKKMDIFEKETEQSSIKIKRLEDECLFYKIRFNQLEIRLKTLLNTHSAQSSYVKKSPVTLAYQKLIKFVHGVQNRASANYSLNPITNSLKVNNMFIDKEEYSDAL